MMAFHPQMSGNMASIGNQGGPRASNQTMPGQQQTSAVISRGPRPPQEGMGPSVTVFVGNITDRAPDNMVRQLCPLVLIFMLTAFGFCEYSNPDSALRAIRLLHDLEIGEKKLVVKVDAKTKVVLDNYKGELNANWYF